LNCFSFLLVVVDREDNGIHFDNSLLLQRQVKLTAMACFVGVAGVVPILTIFFFVIMLYLVIDNGIPFARAQRLLLFARDFTTRPFLFQRSGCKN
jgi:hypothetical protein